MRDDHYAGIRDDTSELPSYYRVMCLVLLIISGFCIFLFIQYNRIGIYKYNNVSYFYMAVEKYYGVPKNSMQVC